MVFGLLEDKSAGVSATVLVEEEILPFFTTTPETLSIPMEIAGLVLLVLTLVCALPVTGGLICCYRYYRGKTADTLEVNQTGKCCPTINNKVD